MNSEQYREFGKRMIDYSANYLDTLRSREVYPNVKPGYLKELIPDSAPVDPEPFENILEDVERVIMPGVTHWHHPNFYAYFPTGNSYPCILADILSDTLGVIGFSWASSPACTELEIVMMDWLAKVIGLPEHFLSSSDSGGGGVIHSTASEATLFTMFVARDIKGGSDTNVRKMVAYGSKLAHSSVERACLLGAVQYTSVAYDHNYSMRGHDLEESIQKDIEKGLIPFCVVATLGTTSCCSFDNLKEIGEVCQKFDLWLHVDAAYAGSAFICEETRHHMSGIELADSFNFNPHKWLLIQFDCSAVWIKDKIKLANAFRVDPLYLQHENQSQAVDFRHWQIPLGRRFRSLKLWFTFRTFGVNAFQKHIRTSIQMADYFANLVTSNDNFELFRPQSMGLVCFRAKGSNDQNKELLARLNGTREVHLTPSEIDETYFLRLAICSTQTTYKDLDKAFELILKHFKDL
ncbi:aromatic-L-amino-acid decarboxylase-like [Symsagittifera roscoffensis]|uniref:aromatic-L-amino-acid decarboxylase-like n=1 Tax=Symsagittifera roscoffensis TaxID=84072 RepID=UPI00307BCC44